MSRKPAPDDEPRGFAAVAAFEAKLPFYAFQARRAALDATQFSIDRDSGYGGTFALIMMAIGAEILVVHLLLWSFGLDILAWIFTALSIYGAFWLVADYRAILHHPVLVGADTLQLRCGFRWRVDVPIDLITEVRTALNDESRGERIDLVPFGEPKIILNTREPVTVDGIYGLRRPTRSLGLRIDDAERFLELLQERRDNAARGSA